MQIIRTIVWIVIAVALALFSLANWQTVEVRIWEGLVLETKLPALVIVAFLLGLLPTWLLHKITRWRMGRRISSLENTIAAQAPGAPLGTSTQFDSTSGTNA
ncbi:MAG: DUF1049 domain-containing protein [Sphingomonadales bacterium]|nr:DUF1049 domain-containing protein [Sphingomonadales bacterium]MDE2569434.1 DUF1049 domain-containing protein [Sphingomonadales bacterium]